MDSPSFPHVPDSSRGCIRGGQGEVIPETGFNPQSQVTRDTRADWWKHIDMSYPRVMRWLSDYKFFGGLHRCFCVPVQYAFAVTASRLAFHEATERFE